MVFLCAVTTDITAIRNKESVKQQSKALYSFSANLFAVHFH